MELLKRLTQVVAPSGNERSLTNLIAEEIKECVDELSYDAMGNLIAHKKGNGKKLMLSAHADEIGLIVTYIDERGFIRFHAIGNVQAGELAGKRVQFLNGTVGVICSEGGNKKEININELYIDIGVLDRASAEKKVKIGDAAGLAGEFIETDDVILSRALDSRAGCYVLIEALKNTEACPNDLYAVFTVQKELGARGAATAAYSVAPDMGIAIDGTNTGDVPGAKYISVKLGGGAAIRVCDDSLLVHSTVLKMMKRVAEESKVGYQLEVLTRGGTDAGVVSLTHGGVPAGALSIPIRHRHSPSEMVAKKDLQDCVALLTRIIQTDISNE